LKGQKAEKAESRKTAFIYLLSLDKNTKYL
jgi:hypothetical protein